MPENGKMKDVDERESSGKRFPITHVYPEGLVTKFTNHAIVQHSEQGEFYLSFFEIVPPAIFGTSEEERLEQIDKIENVSARCISRFVMTEDRMKAIVGAIVANLSKSEARRQSEAARGPKDIKNAG